MKRFDYQWSIKGSMHSIVPCRLSMVLVLLWGLEVLTFWPSFSTKMLMFKIKMSSFIHFVKPVLEWMKLIDWFILLHSLIRIIYVHVVGFQYHTRELLKLLQRKYTVKHDWLTIFVEFQFSFLFSIYSALFTIRVD